MSFSDLIAAWICEELCPSPPWFVSIFHAFLVSSSTQEYFIFLTSPTQSACSFNSTSVALVLATFYWPVKKPPIALVPQSALPFGSNLSCLYSSKFSLFVIEVLNCSIIGILALFGEDPSAERCLKLPWLVKCKASEVNIGYYMFSRSCELGMLSLYFTCIVLRCSSTRVLCISCDWLLTSGDN